ncbi:MAG: PD-(D/E)XK nuclease family protein [Bacteroidota bacterium]
MPRYTTPSFLETVVDRLYKKHGLHLPELTLIFPNKRIGSAFEQCLAARTKPVQSPQILTLEVLVEQLSGLSIAPTLPLVFELYQTFRALRPYQEPFERFYVWGAVLLQDFDVLDKYLLGQADQLFTNLLGQKELERTYEHLTEVQKAAIRSFWRSFDQRLSKHQHDFLRLWKLLPQVYERFRERLLTQGIGYEGLCYRSVCDSLDRGSLVLNHRRLALVGFNALHTAAEKLFVWFQAQVPTDFYWDVDAYYMEDERQEAGYYLRAHQRKPYFRKSFLKPFPTRIQQAASKITLWAVATEVGQAHVASTQLRALMEEQGAQFNPSKTAIVLANESLYLPVLHALPDDAQPVSSTLGYPLYHTHSYQLLRSLLDLQVATSQVGCPPGHLPTSAVIDILGHPHIKYFNKALAQQTIHDLLQRGALYTKQAGLAAASSLYKALFSPLASTKDLIKYLLEVLSQLSPYFQDQIAPVPATEKEAWQQLYQQLSQFQQVVQPLTTFSLQDFTQLLQQLALPIQLSAGGASSNGLQVLRVWETGSLDFDNVFILGMNEGTFPASPVQPSFIPYNLRRGYGLPTADTFQAALDAYYFYRLLQRAQHVCITYSTNKLSGNAGEMSRYLWQLLYETKLPIERHWAAPTIQVNTASPIVIEKDTQIRQALDKFIVKPGQEVRRLTPAALNTYLTCRLRFYFQYIAQLRETPQLPRYIDAIRFGSLLHQVMEALYTPLRKDNLHRPIQPSDLAVLAPEVAKVVQAIWAHTLHQGQQAWVATQGQHAIAQATMTKLVEQLLVLDQAYAPFELLGLEVGRNDKSLHINFELDDGRYIGLRGIIDRIDHKAGLVRVLDYKTGTDARRIASIASLFDRHTPQRNQVAFQILLYAWLFKQGRSVATHKIVPGTISTRLSFEKNFDTHFLLKQAGTQDYIPIKDVTPYQHAFEAGLRSVLAELLAPELPFTQTEDLAQCTTCPYRGICQRY